MTKEKKALAFVEELYEAFGSDVEAVKNNEEPECVVDAMNHMIWILEGIGKVMDED